MNIQVKYFSYLTIRKRYYLSIDFGTKIETLEHMAGGILVILLILSIGKRSRSRPDPLETGSILFLRGFTRSVSSLFEQI